jgi:hypothetical protein
VITGCHGRRLEVTIEAYFNPDFKMPQMIIFGLITLAAMAISLFLIYGVTVLVEKTSRRRGRDYDEEYSIRDAFVDKSQRFFEMIIAGTSVLSFSCAYVILNHLNTLEQTGVMGSLTAGERAFFELWAEGKDFLLLLLILISCVINTLLDSAIIPLKRITRDEKATMRMLAMFFVIILLLYLNYIGDESQYSPVMMYYFGLMVGRFVYFDASFGDFIKALKNMFINLPYMLLNLVLTGGLSFLGFSLGYFLERNYYIMGVFYTHMFMLISIFLIHLIWMIRMLYYKGSRKTRKV